MKDWKNFITISCLLMFSAGIYQNGHAQENLAQQAYAIFQQRRNGELVRTLALGHTPADIYQSRSRAAHWDGKNEVGEAVASGVYFYTLTAGDFTATRKLLIRK